MAGRRTRFARTPFSNAGVARDTITVWSRGALKAIPGGPTIDSNGKLNFKQPYRAVTTANSPYTVVAGDNILGVNSTAGPVAITLPTAASSATGHMITIKDEAGQAESNAITVAAAVGQTIDGSANVVINVPRASIRVYCNGTAWFIF